MIKEQINEKKAEIKELTEKINNISYPIKYDPDNRIYGKEYDYISRLKNMIYDLDILVFKDQYKDNILSDMKYYFDEISIGLEHEGYNMNEDNLLLFKSHEIIKNIIELIVINHDYILEREQEITDQIIDSIQTDFNKNDLFDNIDYYIEHISNIYILIDKKDLSVRIDDICQSDYYSWYSNQDYYGCIIPIGIDLKKIEKIFYSLIDQTKIEDIEPLEHIDGDTID